VRHIHFISWQGEMTNNNSWLLRGISTQPWNEEGVQLSLNLRRHGYISMLRGINVNSKSDSVSFIALICAIWFAISSIYLQIIRTDLDIVKDALSLYAIGSGGFILETGFYSIGITQILIAFMLFKKNAGKKASATAMFLAGLGAVIVGVMPTHVEPVDIIVKLPHVIGATMQFVFFSIAVLLLSKNLCSDGFRRYTISTGIITTMLFILILFLFIVSSKIEINFFGFVEKLEIYAINLWLMAISWKLGRPGGFYSVFKIAVSEKK